MVLLALSSGVVADRLGASAQQAERLHRIGVLTELTHDPSFEQRVRTAFRQHGYVEGRTAAFEFRWASERFETLSALAEELVRLKVDIIMTGSTPPAVAARRATSQIPIITVSADPVGAGLATSLARPGGNVTGLFLPLPELAAKRLQLLREVVPELDIVAIVWNPLNRTAESQFKAAEAAAKAMGVATKSVEMRQQGDVDTVFRTIAATPARGFVVMQDPVTLGAAAAIARLASKYRLPGSHVYRDFVDAGGLMSYGVNLIGTFEASAAYAHRVLSGARPADLPMEQPSRMEFAINVKTAKALGLTMPSPLLLRADHVIE